MSHEPRLEKFHNYKFVAYCADQAEITGLRAELAAQKEISAVFERGQQNACDQLARVTEERDVLRHSLKGCREELIEEVGGMEREQIALMQKNRDIADSLRRTNEKLDDSTETSRKAVELMNDAVTEVTKLRAELAAQKDTARLDYIISESNDGNGWIGDDVWDRCDFANTVDALEPYAEIRRVIDAERGKK